MPLKAILVYNPTAPEDLKSALADLEKFITADDNIDILIKSALIHYQSETIHPFEEGNGRAGRILAMLMLLLILLMYNNGRKSIGRVRMWILKNTYRS